MSYVVLQLGGPWNGEVGEVLDLEASDATLVDQLSEYPYPQMDDATRQLLTAIQDALENGPDHQRYRVAAALHDLLREGSTATVEWATEFIASKTLSR